jgi:hypothetical protein
MAIIVPMQPLDPLTSPTLVSTVFGILPGGFQHTFAIKTFSMAF